MAAAEKFEMNNNEYKTTEKEKFDKMRVTEGTKNEILAQKDWIKETRRSNLYKEIDGKLKEPLITMGKAILSNKDSEAYKNYKNYCERFKKETSLDSDKIDHFIL